MKVFIIDCVAGFFAVDEEKKVVDFEKFRGDLDAVAGTLAATQDGKVAAELLTLVQSLRKKGFKTFAFESEQLGVKTAEETGVEYSMEGAEEIGDWVRSNLETLLVERRVTKSQDESASLIARVAAALASLKMREASKKRDLLIVQAIQTIDDLDRTANLFSSRVREWYGIHFPELDSQIEKHETYLKMIEEFKSRDKFAEEGLVAMGIPPEKADQISQLAQRSTGAPLGEQDLKRISGVAGVALEVYNTRRELETYVDGLMDEVAPNMKALAGAPLGARLIALAGGIESLAKLPASTVQILGAERALFRSLKTGSQPPKHGIIFQHPLIHQSQRWQRGKIARALSGKLAIAARIDAFKGEFAGSRLMKEFEERVQDVKEKYPKPRPKPGPKPEKPGRGKERRRRGKPARRGI